MECASIFWAERVEFDPRQRTHLNRPLKFVFLATTPPPPDPLFGGRCFVFADGVVYLLEKKHCRPSAGTHALWSSDRNRYNFITLDTTRDLPPTRSPTSLSRR